MNVDPPDKDGREQECRVTRDKCRVVIRCRVYGFSAETRNKDWKRIFLFESR